MNRNHFIPKIGLLALSLCILTTACEDKAPKNNSQEKAQAIKSEEESTTAPSTPAPPKASNSVVVHETDEVITKEEANSPSEPPVQNENEALNDELNHYVKCYNRVTSRVHSSQQRYLSWVDPKIGLTCKESHISYGLYTLYHDGIETCQEAAERGKLPPDLPKIEKNAVELAKIYAQLVPLTQKASDYFSQEDYKDDDCQKGKQYHSQLMDLFKRFNEVNQSMGDELNRLEIEMTQKELNEIEKKYGKIAYWYARHWMLQSRLLMNQADVSEQGKVEIKKENYLKYYTELSQSYDEFNTYYEKNQAKLESEAGFSIFYMFAKEFFTKAKFINRDLVGGKKIAAKSVVELAEAFSTMVQHYNILNFSSYE